MNFISRIALERAHKEALTLPQFLTMVFPLSNSDLKHKISFKKIKTKTNNKTTY